MAVNTFVVRGRLDGRRVTLTYDHDDHTLVGDDDAVAMVRERLTNGEAMMLSPDDAAHDPTFEDPAGVLAAIEDVVDLDGIDGDYPLPTDDDAAG
ncbi:MAG: hypothetical protein S0880_37425 [Actinomycetota bacterium]|nr:hypothetical protein [Actinomycetota bacterium]